MSTSSKKDILYKVCEGTGHDGLDLSHKNHTVDDNVCPQEYFVSGNIKSASTASTIIVLW